MSNYYYYYEQYIGNIEREIILTLECYQYVILCTNERDHYELSWTSDR